MKKKQHIKCLMLSLTLLLASCEGDFWFNFIVGPQPNFIEKSEFDPSLNIFGVIRPDSIQGQPMSYVLVEKLMAAVLTQPDSFNVIDAQVKIFRINHGSAVDTHVFVFDTTRLFPSFYRPVDLAPCSGETYALQCVKEGFPDITAITTVPNVPEIANDLIGVDGNSLHFTLLADSTATLYDIYLFTGAFPITQRLMKAQSGNTFVEINFSGKLDENAILAVYAYDSKLSEYVTSSNVFFKPNTFRPPFTNVDGGYGCFGSLNVLMRTVN